MDAARGLGVTRAPQSGPTPPPAETGRFEAVGHTREFGAPGFWHDTSDGMLFLFHLHEFAPLAEYAAGAGSPAGDAFWQSTVDGWLSAHALPRLPAWHPYPTSGRVIAFLSAVAGVDGWPREFRDRIGATAWQQAHYLRRAVEHDIGGNHVIRNGSALAVAGAVFRDRGLQRAGQRILRREAARQILADGGHVERSPSYQRQVTDDLRDALTASERANAPCAEEVRAAIARSERCLQHLAGPHGKLPLLNDAWSGPELTPAGDGVLELSETGYTVFRAGGDYAVFDHGPLSAPHLPPHAHADALSFVLALDGEDVVTDRGSFTYSGEARNEFRSTASHSTVQIGGRDQCEFWGDFRLASPPRVHAERRQHGPVTVVSAWHDGYRRLNPPVTHARNFVWWPGHGAVAVDLLLGDGGCDAVSRLHLAPDTDLRAIRIDALGTGGDVERRHVRHSPYLGSAVSAPVLERSIGAGRGGASGWSVLRAGTVESLRAEELVLRGEDGNGVSIPLAWPDT